MHAIKKLVRKIIPTALLANVELAYRLGRGLLWQLRYGFPARGMRVIAVTGTNGKSTTVAYINEVLKAAGYKTAALSTVFYETAGKRTANKTHFTIDKQSIVQSFFAQAKKADVDFVVFEITSHALDQHRFMGVGVEIAVITNLSQEHLDYHKTMENYARAKSLLLRDFGAGHAVLNADDEWYEYFKGRSKAEVFKFGKSKGADLRIASIKLSEARSDAMFSHGSDKFDVSTKLPGEFNLYNAAAAAGVGTVLGIDSKKIGRGIANLNELDGRMQEISEGQDFRVVVDFAITPDAIEKALKALQAVTKGKVRIVFGATGDRDKEKRPVMGKTAVSFADQVYLTDDETYTENPQKIRDDVFAGIKQAKGTKKTQVIPDRKQAITKAFEDSNKNDAVLITGLGHEDSRNMEGKLVPWQDQKIAAEVLRKLG